MSVIWLLLSLSRKAMRAVLRCAALALPCLALPLPCLWPCLAWPALHAQHGTARHTRMWGRVELGRGREKMGQG